mmetsp:Transcript_26585/g.59054  ORF Transcript_26585/g.59054 Transcript_26585/m.59054 type:complete len:200 (+) Transcript_26585:617-1216(+)
MDRKREGTIRLLISSQLAQLLVLAVTVAANTLAVSIDSDVSMPDVRSQKRLNGMTASSLSTTTVSTISLYAAALNPTLKKEGKFKSSEPCIISSQTLVKQKFHTSPKVFVDIASAERIKKISPMTLVQKQTQSMRLRAFCSSAAWWKQRKPIRPIVSHMQFCSKRSGAYLMMNGGQHARYGGRSSVSGWDLPSHRSYNH